MVIKKTINNASLPLKLSLEKANAANIVVINVPIVEKIATTIVFLI